MKPAAVRRFAAVIVLPLTYLLCLATANGQAVLLEDDFERGWENAQTHRFLPGWSGIAPGFLPATNGDRIPVEVMTNGSAFTVWIDGGLLGTFEANATVAGQVGVHSWASSGTVAGPFYAEVDGATVVASDWQPTVAWRRLRTTNSAGTTVPETTNENLSWLMSADGRYQETSNYFTRATQATPNVDFMGTTIVADDPAAQSWTDYTVQARLLNTDNDGIGLITYAANANNFYRVVFCNEVTQSGNWAAHERAPQGVSVQKVRNGVWTELYRTDPADPDFIFQPGTPFDVQVSVESLFFGNRISIRIVNDPAGNAAEVTLPVINDSNDPLPGGAPGLFQWGSSGANWLSYGDDGPFAVAADQTVLLESPFVTEMNGWLRNDIDQQHIEAPANWRVRLLPEPLLSESSNGRLVDGTDDNCAFTPYALVNDTPLTGSSQRIMTTLGSFDDDGFGLVFGYQDNANYLSVNLRAQPTNLGFPQGVSVREVVDGVATCLEPVDVPQRAPLAGVWLQKLTSGALENVGAEGLADGSGKDGVEFQGPRIVYGEADWNDYTFEATIHTGDVGALGLLARFQDEENFYRVTFNSAHPRAAGDPPIGVSVQKVHQGDWTELWRDERPTAAGGFIYDPAGADGPASFRVRLTCTGTDFTLDVLADAADQTTPLYTRSWTDASDPLTVGKVGLHTYRHTTNEFADLSIELSGGAPIEPLVAATAPTWRDVTLLDTPGDINDAACGSEACMVASPSSGIGVRPDVAAFGARDNRWVAGTAFVVPDQPDTPAIDPDHSRGTVNFDGPRAVVGANHWENYRITATLKAIDDDGVGLLFRHQDPQNFYRLMFMSQAENPLGGPPRGVSVQKREAGVYQEIFFSDRFIYTPGERWLVELVARGSFFTLEVRQLDGDVDGDGQTRYRFDFNDPTRPLLTGAVGFTTWGAAAAVPEHNSLLTPNGLDWTEHFDEGGVLEHIIVRESRLPGDLNCDGAIDFFDIDAFVAALISPGLYRASYPQCELANGDLNQDGAVDFFDIDPFVTALLAREEFSVVVLPDTQIYSQRYPHHFAAQTEWIVNNIEQRNIKFVLHEGDITNWNNQEQWENAKAAMMKLDGVIPYAMAPGNHDYGPGGNAADRTTLFNDFFPRSDYADEPWFGGTFEPDKLDSSYHFFRAGGEDWLVLALEWGPRDQVVAWANDVLAQYPDHRVIVVTHAYMYYDETRYDHVTRPEQRWNPHNYGTANLPGGVNDGEELWQKLIRKHPHVVLVCSGHVLNDGAGRLSSVNDFGNTVHQILTNYQMRPEGGEGYLRIYTFSADGKTISAESYSPVRDEYLTGPQQQFELTLDPPLGSGG